MHSPQTKLRIGCLTTLVLFSALLAIGSFPSGAWRFGAAFGTLALVSIFLRVGWLIPSAIAGTYAGIMVDARLKGGPIDYQMQQTVTSLVLGALLGAVIGGSIDALRHSRPLAPSVENSIGADEETDESKQE